MISEATILEISKIPKVTASALLGTIAGAAAFGLILAGPIGFCFGPVIALFVGILVVPSIVVVSWCFWLLKFRITIGFLAGSGTGIVCAGGIADGPIPFVLPGYAIYVLAGLFGGFNAAMAVGVLTKDPNAEADSNFKFTISSMLIRISILAFVLGFWVLLKDGFEHHKKRINQIQQQRIESTSPTAEPLYNSK